MNQAEKHEVEVAATRALRELGKDEAELVESLARLGVRGVRGDCDECPLARWLAAFLREKFPQFLWRRVFVTNTIIGAVDNDFQRFEISFRPYFEYVSEFITNTDAGRHQRLTL